MGRKWLQKFAVSPVHRSVVDLDEIRSLPLHFLDGPELRPLLGHRVLDGDALSDCQRR